MPFLRKSDFVAAPARQGLAEGRMAGLPFLALSLTPAFLFASPIVLVAFLFTALATFCIHIPVVAGALGLAAEDQADEPLTLRAYSILLLLWAATDWSIAALWR